MSAWPDRIRGCMRQLASVLGLGLAGFTLYTAFFGALAEIPQRSLHLALVLGVVFLAVPMRKGQRENAVTVGLDLVLFGLASFVALYLWLNFDRIALRGMMPNTADIWVGMITVLVVIESCRRVLGWPLPIVALTFLAYTIFGRNLPGILAHKGFGFHRIVSFAYLGTEGIFGIPLGIAATFIAMFVVFGQLLRATGAGKLFIDLAYSLTGGFRGGAAKTAVLASAGVGTITGVATANVVITGTFTIPLMKRQGYSPAFAAGVEAAASTGGQIMPPVMGAAAFILAEFAGVTYGHVMLAALVPALLYYLGIFCAVDLEAVRLGLRGLPRRELPSPLHVLREGYYHLGSLVVLVVLIALQFSPMYAAFWACLAMLLPGLMRRRNRVAWRTLLDALAGTGREAANITTACATAGIIIGMLNLTGLGLRFSSIALRISGGELIPMLLVTMVVCLILGMGLPTAGAYIVTAIVAAPALTDVGLPPLVAHLFIFYFAIIANITPPVDVAAYVAAGIAGAEPIRTSLVAVRFAVGAFLVAFLFATDPRILITFAAWHEFIRLVPTAAMGVFCLSAAFVGQYIEKLSWPERLLMGIASLTLLDPDWLTDLLGLAVLVGITLLHLRRRGRWAMVEAAHPGGLAAPGEQGEAVTVEGGAKPGGLV